MHKDIEMYWNYFLVFDSHMNVLLNFKKNQIFDEEL